MTAVSSLDVLQIGNPELVNERTVGYRLRGILREAERRS